MLCFHRWKFASEMDLRIDGGCQEGGFSKMCEAGSSVRTQRQLHRLWEVESTNKMLDIPRLW